MSEQPVTVTIDRPTTAALGCAAGTGALLFVFTVGAACFALGVLATGAATAFRVTAAVAAVAFAALLVVVSTGVSRGRRGATLTFTAHGIEFTDRRGTHELGWSDIAEATVDEPSGPKRASSGAPTLRLRPHDAKRVAEDHVLRDRLTLPAHDAGAEPVFWLSFALPADAEPAVRDALARFAPDGS